MKINTGLINSFYSFSSLFLKSLSNIGMPFLVANMFGVDVFSNFSFVVILGSLMLVFSEYGSFFWMPNSASHDNPDFKKQFSSDIFHEALNFRLLFILGAAGVLSLLFIVDLISMSNYFLVLALVLYSLFSLFYYSFRAHGFFKEEFFLSLTLEATVFSIAVISLLVFRDYELFVLTFFLTRLVLLFYIFVRYSVSPRLSLFQFINTINVRFFYFLQIFVSFIVLYVDTLFVKVFYESQLYLHQGFLRLLLLSCLFIPVMNSICLYYLRKRFLISVPIYRIFLKQVIFCSLFLVLFVSISSYIIFPKIVNFILGDKYLALPQYAVQFAIIIFLKYMSTAFGLNLTVIGRQSVRAKILLAVFFASAAAFYYGFVKLTFFHVFDLIVFSNTLLFVCYFVSYFVCDPPKAKDLNVFLDESMVNTIKR